MVPDGVVFGWNESKEAIFYRDVRMVKDENRLINLLQLRLEAFYFSQVTPLEESRSAFPLLVMTCIGMETLGQIFSGEKAKDGDAFVWIARKMHQFFGRNPSKQFAEGFVKNWPKKDWDGIDCFGRLLYKFLRNTMVHGYQGKAVFLSYEDTDTYLVDDNDSFVTINPTWFWGKLQRVREQLFQEALSGQANSSARKNCLTYIEWLLYK